MKRDSILFLISIIIFVFSIFSLANVLNEIEREILTGRATDASTINITIDELAMLNFTVSSVDWGTGAIERNSTYAIIDTEGNVTNGTWDPVTSGFVIANIGNVNLSISFSSLHDENSFIGGSDPEYMYMISNNQEFSCIPPSGLNLTAYYDLPEAGTPVQLCQIFQPNKSITFNLKLKIPDDSLVGNLSDTISVSFEKALA